MLGTLTIDNRSFNAYGLFATDAGIYNAPEPDIKPIPIAGRNGVLLRSNDRYNNITIKYPCLVPNELASNIEMIKGYLLTNPEYVRIEDSFETDYYRMGRFVGGTKVKPALDGTAGAFELEFDCKPQRFLKSGETVISRTSAGSISNPTLFPAKPLIKITGSGNVTLTVGTYTVTISGISSYINLDCEDQDAYKTAAENENNKVTLPAGQGYPVLVPGSNAISWTGTVTRVEITPRWWTL